MPICLNIVAIMEIPLEVCGNSKDNVTTADSSSFKYKSSLLGSPVDAGDGDNAHALRSYAKIVVPLRYLANFFRS